MSELAVINSHENMVGLIEKALVDPKVDVHKMEKMLDVQERIYDKNAQIAFNAAMAACQKDMPAIAKTAKNAQTNSNYAKYETIITDTKPTYTSHGFSISFGEGKSDKENHIRVTAELMHEQGHSKEFHADLPLDLAGIKGNQNKTEVHATGSTFSYAKRYLFCMIFNVAMANEDDDAISGGGLTIQSLLEYNAVIREEFFSIAATKEALMNGDYSAAKEAWAEIDIDDQRAIWRAPTKGGILTTEERTKMKSNEWSAA